MFMTTVGSVMTVASERGESARYEARVGDLCRDGNRCLFVSSQRTGNSTNQRPFRDHRTNDTNDTDDTHYENTAL